MTVTRRLSLNGGGYVKVTGRFASRIGMGEGEIQAAARAMPAI
jgi:hypothetical protein